MGYRYPAGAVRRLDDALLAVFGDRYLSLHGNAHRVALLREQAQTAQQRRRLVRRLGQLRRIGDARRLDAELLVDQPW